MAWLVRTLHSSQLVEIWKGPTERLKPLSAFPHAMLAVGDALSVSLVLPCCAAASTSPLMLRAMGIWLSLISPTRLADPFP